MPTSSDCNPYRYLPSSSRVNVQPGLPAAQRMVDALDFLSLPPGAAQAATANKTTTTLAASRYLERCGGCILMSFRAGTISLHRQLDHRRPVDCHTASSALDCDAIGARWCAAAATAAATSDHEHQAREEQTPEQQCHYPSLA